MRAAPLHPRERERLDSLAEHGVLDTPPEPAFDALARLATISCDAAACTLSFFDQTRGWFKARVRYEPPEIPRHLSICAHAMLQPGFFEIPDLRIDPRFSDTFYDGDGIGLRHYAGVPLRDAQGLPLGMICVLDPRVRTLSTGQRRALEDLAEMANALLAQRRTLLALDAAEQIASFHHAVFQHMSDGVVVHDHTGAIVRYNPAALTVLGLSEDEILGKTSLDPRWQATREDGTPFPGEEHPAMVALRTGVPQCKITMGIRTPDGKQRWITIRAAPVFREGGQTPSHAVATFSDITERRETQALLFQHDKMKSLGEMAGSIAHEINTPLAVILANAEYLVEEFEARSVCPVKHAARARAIGTTALRIAAIVRGLRSFARESSLDPKVDVPLRAIVDDALALCGQKLQSAGVALEVEVRGSPSVNVVPVRLVQVLVNLLGNAFDAVTDAAEEAERKWIRILAREEGGHALLSVVDAGRGIPAGVVGKIMTPFFTTKPVGKGTGLGLSISKGLVEDAGGTLTYHLEQGHTCFTVRLDAKGDAAPRVEGDGHAA